MKRRELLLRSGILATSIILGCSEVKEEGNMEIYDGEPKINGGEPKVYVIKTDNRREGIEKLLKYFKIEELKGKTVAIKANYNSDDPFPASTHPDTLDAIAKELERVNAKAVLAERSGMGNTAAVLKNRGVFDILARHGFSAVDLEGHNRWVRIEAEHWKRGFLMADIFYESDCVIQTCCLKTHRFGGHFTLSLKNSVGMVARHAEGHDYMKELHTSEYQRYMIAEINIGYSPHVVILDAVQGFSKGGPESGEIINPGVILAGNDRVAVDAVGVAILRLFGTTPEVSNGPIFSQDQIKRAVQLGLGVSEPEEIDVVPVNDDATEICSEISSELVKRS
ncbi:DUF362 domain-containing protein [Geoglobus acetivorans]